MTTTATARGGSTSLTEPVRQPADRLLQEFGHSRRPALGLDANVASASVGLLNQLLADTITLRDLYKKHHWQASGPTFWMLHVLFDTHAATQTSLVDLLAERVQTLGGVALAMGVDVAEACTIPRAPKGMEGTAAQLARLLHAHEVVLVEARAMVRATEGDPGTNDILVSEVIRTNELQVWFLSQHLQVPA